MTPRIEQNDSIAFISHTLAEVVFAICQSGHEPRFRLFLATDALAKVFDSRLTLPQPLRGDIRALRALLDKEEYTDDEIKTALRTVVRIAFDSQATWAVLSLGRHARAPSPLLPPLAHTRKSDHLP